MCWHGGLKILLLLLLALNGCDSKLNIITQNNQISNINTTIQTMVVQNGAPSNGTVEASASPEADEAPVTQPSRQPIPTAVSSAMPTATPLSAQTPMPTATPLSAQTPMPTATPLPALTVTPMATPIPTAAPSVIPTATPLPAPTPTPTPVPFPTPPAGTITNSLGMTFVPIAPGTFQMGSPTSEVGRGSDETQHTVTLRHSYYLQTTEVTQAQWQAVMGSNPSSFKGANLPVESVSWNDIQQFIQLLNQRGEGSYRLPTEAEWEYAARSGTNTAWFCGSSESCLDQVAWYNFNSSKQTHPVGQKQANAWGLYDMHGNVWEWVQDWRGDYPNEAVTDPQGPSAGVGRILRGGAWGFSAGLCRSAGRYDLGQGSRGRYFGFRIIRGF